MKKIVILTNSELRHQYVRMYIAKNKEINVLKTYCESEDGNLSESIEANDSINKLRLDHLSQRKQSEVQYFDDFVSKEKDLSNAVIIRRREINSPKILCEIIALNPDYLVAYGCSIIKGELLELYRNRILNVHLGLSPYYKGAGTNFWPLVNGEPEFIGASFIFLDAGIDTGEIIHQIRAEVRKHDTPHDIGNRLIQDVAKIYSQLICRLNSLPRLKQIPCNRHELIYKTKDFSEESLKLMYGAFQGGMIREYIDNQHQRCNNAPILSNKGLE